MSDKGGLPVQDPEDLRGMNRGQIDRIRASAPHGCLARHMPQEPAPSRLSPNLRHSWALYLPEEGEEGWVLRRIHLESEVGKILLALDRCESTTVLIAAAPEKDLEPYLKGKMVLGLGFWDRNWKPVSWQDLEQLGVKLDQAAEPQPAEPVPVESDVGPGGPKELVFEELVHDVEL